MQQNKTNVVHCSSLPVQNRLQLRQGEVSSGVVEGEQIPPRPGERPLDSLQPPEHMKGNAILANGFGVDHRGKGRVNGVVQREHLPARVTRGGLQQPHPQPLQDVCGLELSVAAAQSPVQKASEVVSKELICSSVCVCTEDVQ